MICVDTVLSKQKRLSTAKEAMQIRVWVFPGHE